jgi:hypothetical protein
MADADTGRIDGADVEIKRGADMGIQCGFEDTTR